MKLYNVGKFQKAFNLKLKEKYTSLPIKKFVFVFVFVFHRIGFKPYPMENIIGKHHWKTSLENIIGKHHWKISLEINNENHNDYLNRLSYMLNLF